MPISPTYLTFTLPSWYLNFSTLFTKNVLLGNRKIKLWNKQNFVENKTEFMQYVLKIQSISLLPEHMKWIFIGIFLCVCTCKCRSWKVNQKKKKLCPKFRSCHYTIHNAGLWKEYMTFRVSYSYVKMTVMFRHTNSSFFLPYVIIFTNINIILPVTNARRTK